MAEEHSSTEVLATALRELREAAGKPPYTTMARQARAQQPAISMTPASLCDWLKGKHVPAKPEAFKFLVRYLQSEAKRRNRGFQTATDEWWEERYEAALKERNGRRGGRPSKSQAKQPDFYEYPSEQGNDDDSEPPPPVFATVEEYVTERFVVMYSRVLSSEVRWCSRWWMHAEAISRLTAIWHSWEAKRWEPDTGISGWYTDFLDPQIQILMGPKGPFALCNEYEHNEIPQMRCLPAPKDYWSDTDESTDLAAGKEDPL